MLAHQLQLRCKYSMTTEAERKEAYRLFWMVKGMIAENENTAMASADSYFKRLWFDGSNGAPLYEYEQGFEQAYNGRFHNAVQRDRLT
jgi:hypothetical protein